ncbi:MAG: RecX family transcriptional regulator, partial [Muribaculaceae bacterium]|nr:RecX family transcriptional regulator [Muribaculaceae bacterium]
SDVRGKLLRWGLTPQQAQEVIDRLIDGGYLDDERYARAFVHDKFRFNGWGRIKIAYQLRAKGISQDCIDEALTLIDDESYEQALLQLLTAKASTLRGKEPQQARAALLRFATGRGYEPALCYRMADNIIHNPNDFD